MNKSYQIILLSIFLFSFPISNFIDYLSYFLSFGFDLYINWDLPVILCEGAFDAMAIKRNAIPLFGKKISSTLMKKILTSNCNKIYLALDEDALKDALEHAKKLMGYGKRVYFIEMGDKDPSELGFEQFTQLLHSAEELTMSSLVRKKLALS